MSASLVFTSCNGGNGDETEGQDSTAVAEVSEFDLLVKHIEGNGDFINSKKVPTMITAEKVHEMLGETIHIIDLRSGKDFAGGHIDGAENVKLSELIDYMESIDATSFEKVVLVCYSGQSASLGTSVLQLLGYDNAYAMKWGMSGWNPKFAAEKWLAKVSDKYEDVLETTENAKAAAGEYPTLSTGLATGEEILKNRAQAVLQNGFKAVSVSIDDVMGEPSAFYILNYWPKALYDKGHITGAVQYDPKKSLGTTTSLNTLPTDKPVVTYCFTGQHAAFVTAYLSILGYDARTISYGANSFMNNMMKTDEEIGHGFSKKASMNYPTITSEYVESEETEEAGGC